MSYRVSVTVAFPQFNAILKLTMSNRSTERDASKESETPDAVALDFVRKCRHVERLLGLQGIPDAHEVAAGWVLAFFDEGDPTFCVLEWLHAGWRDPELVNAALRICENRSDAESCLAQLDVDLGSAYDYETVGQMAVAMCSLPRRVA